MSTAAKPVAGMMMRLLNMIGTRKRGGNRKTTGDAIMMALSGAIGPKDNGGIHKDNAVSAYLDVESVG